MAERSTARDEILVFQDDCVSQIHDPVVNLTRNVPRSVTRVFDVHEDRYRYVDSANAREMLRNDTVALEQAPQDVK